MKLKKSSKQLKKRKPLILLRRVVGHSMLPVLPPGTLVIGVRRKKIKPGHVVIFNHNGKEKIKRIEDVTQTKIYLTGDHPQASTDSRHFGWLDDEVVIARVIYPKAKL